MKVDTEAILTEALKEHSLHYTYSVGAASVLENIVQQQATAHARQVAGRAADWLDEQNERRPLGDPPHTMLRVAHVLLVSEVAHLPTTPRRI